MAGAFSGCGGDDEPDENRRPAQAAPTPSKREFIARADKVCAYVERKSMRQGRKGEPDSPEELVRRARQTTALQREAVRRLEAIGLPADPEERRGARAFLDSIRAIDRPVKALERAATQVETAADKDSEQAAQAAVLNLQEALIDIEQADQKSHRAAKRAGLKDCAEEHEPEESQPGKSRREREAS